MTVPDLLLKLAVHHLSTSNHPIKQSDYMAIAISYPVDAMFGSIMRYRQGTGPRIDVHIKLEDRRTKERVCMSN